MRDDVVNLRYQHHLETVEQNLLKIFSAKRVYSKPIISETRKRKRHCIRHTKVICIIREVDPGEIISKALFDLKSKIRTERRKVEDNRRKCHTPLEKEMLLERERDQYIKKQNDKEERLRKKAIASLKEKNKRIKEDIERKKHELESSKLQKSIRFLTPRDYRIKDSDFKQQQIKEQVQLRIKTAQQEKQRKFDAWNQNYKRVLVASEEKENLQHKSAIKSLKRLEDTFKTVQFKYEERLIRTSQEHFIQSDKSKALIRNNRGTEKEESSSDRFNEQKSQ